MKTNNMDIAGVIRRSRRFRFETVKAVSSSLANVSASDFNRAKSYLNALTVYLDHVVAQPQLDLPEWAPHDINLGEPEVISMPENEALVDLLMMYDAMEVEIGHSQSSRQATGIVSHDELRIRNIIAKMENFLDGYISNVLPLDLPESSPLRENTGAGRKGV